MDHQVISNSNHDNQLFSVSNVHKAFGINMVLKGINLRVGRGEVLALIGGNGAGKSTLMKIIMGIYRSDQGNIYIQGERMITFSPSIALAKGIYMVPQEPMLFPNMTVEENILIGFHENQIILKQRLLKLMEEIGWLIDLKRKAMSLSIAEQQLVELIRGMLRNAKLLILDEPTSALTFDEVTGLFRIINDLKQKGIGIIYITHRLTEVFEIATHVAIMRDGTITLEGRSIKFNREMLVQGLLPPNGGHVSKSEPTEDHVIDYDKLEPVLELKQFSGYGFEDINLKVFPGEILGLAGVVGAGRTELAITIFGKDKVRGGQVLLCGTDITGYSTKKVLMAGMNYVTEDRRQNGIFTISDVAANMTSSILSGNQSIGKIFLNKKEEQKVTQRYVDEFRIKVTGMEQMAGSLSGGNQQKIVIGRSLSTAPKLVILDEPTRGIDAAARADVYAIIRKLKKQGVAIMLISSDLEEIVEMSDRTLVIFQGRIKGEFQRAEVNQNSLMSASFGVMEKEQEGR